MSTSEDQFAVPDLPLLGTLKTLKTYSAKTATVTKLGIVAADNTQLDSLITPFAAVVLVMEDVNAITKLIIQQRDTTRGNVVAFARKFVQKWYYNNLSAEAEDILAASLVPHADGRISHEGATIETPVMLVNSVTGHKFDVVVKDAAGSLGKPVNIVFIRVRYFIITPGGAPAPADAADFTKMKDFSKHPITLVLLANDAGKEIKIACCYVDAQGNEGDYSAIVDTNIT